MACPKCECKETYPYHEDGWESFTDIERCASCGLIFDIEESLDEDDDF